MDKQQISEIYRENCHTLYRLCCFYMKNEQDALDVMHNTFVKLMEYQGEFEGAAHVKNWLVRVAVNECKDIVRHWWRKTLDVEECILPGRNTVEEYMQSKAVVEQLMKLPVKSRLVLYLFYFEGYATKEIAQILNMNESTVRSALRRGRIKLRLEMEEE